MRISANAITETYYRYSTPKPDLSNPYPDQSLEMPERLRAGLSLQGSIRTTFCRYSFCLQATIGQSRFQVFVFLCSSSGPLNYRALDSISLSHSKSNGQLGL